MELSNICEYSSKRIDSSLLTVENYVSTENMMQNKGGITLAAKVPVENSVEFLPGDILISNIRPYFRKIFLRIRFLIMLCQEQKVAKCPGEISHKLCNGM